MFFIYRYAFLVFSLPTVQPSNITIRTETKVLNTSELCKLYFAFPLVGRCPTHPTTGKIGQICWSASVQPSVQQKWGVVQHVLLRPTVQPLCGIYILFNEKVYISILQDFMYFYILKCWTVGRLDACFWKFFFQNYVLLFLFYFRGCGGLECVDMKRVVSGRTPFTTLT